MKDKLLLFDLQNNSKLYEREVIAFLKNQKFYYPVFKYESVKSFLCNLIIALANDAPITLIDSDFSWDELKELSLESQVNVPISISQETPWDKRNWLERIQHSSSQISLFTSGTTGLPKKVVHSIDSLTRMVRIGENYLGNKWVLAYNPTHMAGLQVIFQSLFNLNPLLNVFGTTIQVAAQGIQDFEATNISATPTYYRMLVGINEVFKKINRATLGGEKSGEDLHRRLNKTFPNAKINNIYASTELGSLFVSKGEEFVVLDKFHDKFRIDSEGELLVHKSMLGHLSIAEDWYKTGDLVEVTSSEPLSFVFKSRNTEMINTGGYKVNPNDVEAVINQYPGILNSRVFGKPNSILGTVLCAEIQLIQGLQFDKGKLQRFISNHLQDFKVPRIIKVVDEFETTRTGKLIRK